MLLARTLEVVRGHPMLIRLADQQAAVQGVLDARVRAAGQSRAAGMSRADALFAEGAAAPAAAGFLRGLARWTRQVTRAQPPATRAALRFLACLEDDDRFDAVPEQVWPAVWRKIGHGACPVLASAVSPLASEGLVLADADGYVLHPAAADLTRAECGLAFRGHVYREMGSYWTALFEAGLEAQRRGGQGTMLRAAHHAAPYVVRLHDWPAASAIIRHILDSDPSPATAAGLLPLLREAANLARGTGYQITLRHSLARALGLADPPEPADSIRAMLDELLAAATAAGDFRTATQISADLIALTCRSGQLDLASSLAAQRARAIRRAGLGPWSRADNQVRSLGIKLIRGRDRYVFAACRRLLTAAEAITWQSGADEITDPWRVREDLLAAGANAADNLKRWGESLVWTAARVRSMERRSAPRLETARARYDAYFALLQANFLPEARELLRECRVSFERERDYQMAGLATGALASVEERAGHVRGAIQLSRDALRLAAITGDTTGAGGSFGDLADYLAETRAGADTVVGYRLAGALLQSQANSRWLVTSLRLLARDLSRLPIGTGPPSSIVGLSALLDADDADSLSRVLTFAPVQAPAPDAALADLLHRARSVPVSDLAHIEPDFGTERAAFGDIISAVGGGRASMAGTLAARTARAEWRSLLIGLGRVAVHDQGGRPAAGLGPVDAFITEAFTKILSGRGVVAPDLAVRLFEAGRSASSHDPGFPEGLMRVATAMVAAGPGRDLQAARGALVQLAHGDDPALGFLAVLLRRKLAGHRVLSLTELTVGLESPEAMAADIARSLEELAEVLENAITVSATVEEHTPLINAVVAEARGGTASSAGLRDLLAEMMNDQEWSQLARVLYRILEGHRSPDLADGLGAEDAGIVTAILDKLHRAH
jgi:hypothetical protein